MRTSRTVSCSVCALFLTATLASPAQSLSDRLKQKIKDKATQQASDAEAAAENAGDKSGSDAAGQQGPAPAPAAPADQQAATAAPAPEAGIRVYQNYDFTPGDTIVFTDDFTATQDGEFPDRWELLKGQGVVNKQQGYPSMVLTDGNYVQVSPRVKQKTYLGPQFTVEYDTFFEPGAYPVMVFFENGDNEANLSVNASEATYTNGSDSFNLNASLPAAARDENYQNHWHHIAVAVKNKQMKLYVDQNRVLTVPDMHMEPQSLVLGGLGSPETPLIFRNVRIAAGGGMNMVGQKFTEAKIVTHGINFDVDKATLRPESMGTLNQIKALMAANPDVKFEIDGHTDNSGSAAHNMTLSQQRADAVKAQLVAIGVPDSKLSTRGFGDTKPLGPNDTPEAKANNRRVEFVRVN